MDYTNQLNIIIGRLNDLIDGINSLKIDNDLIFMLLAIMLILYVARGE